MVKTTMLKLWKVGISKLELIENLESQGLLKLCVVHGLISPQIYRDKEIYLFINKELKRGVKMKVTLLNAEDKFRICRATIYNSLKRVK